MTRVVPADLPRSVKGRLLDIYHARGGDFTLLLTQYGNERLLYRLSVSPYAERFVLKGALLFVLWSPRPHRATRDIDLLGSGDNSSAELTRVFQDVCTVKCPDDGKDFYDLWVMVRSFDFDGRTLSSAIRATFARRGTSFAVSPPVALTTDYSRNQEKLNLTRLQAAVE